LAGKGARGASLRSQNGGRCAGEKANRGRVDLRCFAWDTRKKLSLRIAGGVEDIRNDLMDDEFRVARTRPRFFRMMGWCKRK